MIKVEVLMHKRTAKLVEHCPDTWLGGVIFYGPTTDDKPIDDDTPIIFDDDKRYRLDRYEKIGEWYEQE